MNEARIFHNLARDPVLDTGNPSKNPLAFHQRLPGYAPTPLVRLKDLAKKLGVAEIYLKDESSRLALPSFKILGASWAVYRALSQRLEFDFESWRTLDDLHNLIRPLGALAVVSATDGNHGRAVARMAALLSLKAKIFVPKGTAVSRIQAIESEGAQVIEVGETYEEAVEHAAIEEAQGALLIQDTAWSGYEEIPRWVVEGYSTLFWEVDDVIASDGLISPDLVLLQMGVGSFAASGVIHFRRSGSTAARIYGVEPITAACGMASLQAGALVTVSGPHTSVMAGLNCGRLSSVAWGLLLRGLDGAITVEDSRAVEAVRELAATGVISGESGAAGVAGLLELFSNSGRDFDEMRSSLTSKTRVFVVSTEGATDPLSYSHSLTRG